MTWLWWRASRAKCPACYGAGSVTRYDTTDWLCPPREIHCWSCGGGGRVSASEAERIRADRCDERRLVAGLLKAGDEVSRSLALEILRRPERP